MKNKRKIFSFLTVLLLAALACNLNLGGPETPEETIKISEDEAKSLVEAWEDAFNTARETGVVSLSLTQDQMTSFLALSMSKQETALLTDPRVILRDGEMEIVGSYDTGTIKANVGIVMSVNVDELGQPRIEVISGNVGPLPVPPELLTGVSEVVNQSLTGQIGTMATGFTLETIDINDGSLSINGTLK